MGKLTAFVCVVCLAASVAFGLDIGDKAPSLSIAKWVKGDPVDPSKPDGKATYVVEFWATWCPPCRQSIPHLSALQAKLKDKGVIVIGISSEDVGTVEPFVKKQTQMEYHVAVDDAEKTNAVWMKDVEGIPHAFVVNKDGVIVWAGHPIDGLDAALEGILAGTLDVESVKKAAQKKAELQKAMQGGDVDAILAIVNDLLQLEPTNYQHYSIKLQALSYKNDPDELAKTRQLAAQTFVDAKASGPLNNLAWSLVTDDTLSKRDPELALKCANEAVQITERKSAGILDTLARVYYSIGMLDKALTVEKEALAAAGEDEKADMEGTIKFYEKAIALRTKLEAAGK